MMVVPSQLSTQQVWKWIFESAPTTSRQLPHQRSWPTLAKLTLASVSVLVVWATLAKTDFGKIKFDLLCVVCGVCECVCCVGGYWCHGCRCRVSIGLVMFGAL